MFRIGLELARKGADIAPVANNYIAASADVTAYLPRHGGYKLDRTAGAILLYGVMPTAKVDEGLAAQVKSANPETRDAAAIVWSLNLTAVSFKGLTELGSMYGFSEQVKQQIQKVLTPVEIKTTAPKYTRQQVLAKIATSLTKR